MNKLFIVGDSFASEPPVGDDYKPWFRQAGDLLNLEVENPNAPASRASRVIDLICFRSSVLASS